MPVPDPTTRRSTVVSRTGTPAGIGAVEAVVTMHDSMARTRWRRPGFPTSGRTVNSNVLMSGTGHSRVYGQLLERRATGTYAHGHHDQGRSWKMTLQLNTDEIRQIE